MYEVLASDGRAVEPFVIGLVIPPGGGLVIGSVEFFPATDNTAIYPKFSGVPSAYFEIPDDAGAGQ